MIKKILAICLILMVFPLVSALPYETYNNDELGYFFQVFISFADPILIYLNTLEGVNSASVAGDSSIVDVADASINQFNLRDTLDELVFLQYLYYVENKYAIIYPRDKVYMKANNGVNVECSAINTGINTYDMRCIPTAQTPDQPS